MLINEQIYKDKLLACWLGKNIGGTVGFPMEFDRQKNIVEDYGRTFDNPMPNDDLDIQLLWLIAMEEKGMNITTERLGEYWQRYITPHWGEYGIAKVNMRTGILPPMSGAANNNYYKHSNGAWIRTEIWACLAPGRPETAISYAVKDCVIDHGNGEGSWAAVFCAAMQSLAFVDTNIKQVVYTALKYIPEDCGVAKAIRDGIACYDKGLSLDEARNYMLEHHRGRYGRSVCKEDADKGYGDGVLGYDAPLNVAIVVMGMLYGEGNFDKVVKSTIFFGEDTDCTVGTAASTYGILYGSSIIEEKWSKPIGNRITVACLNLGELGAYGDVLPQTIEEFSDRVYRCHRILGEQYGLPNARDGFDTDSFDLTKMEPSADYFTDIHNALSTVSFVGDFISARVDYLDNTCSIMKGVPRPVDITISSEYKTADVINYRWLLPEGVTVSPAESGRIFLMFKGYCGMGEKTLRFDFITESNELLQRCVLELTIDGRTTSLYIPVTLLLTPGSGEEAAQ